MTAYQLYRLSTQPSYKEAGSFSIFNNSPSTFSWLGYALLVVILSFGASWILKPQPYAQIPVVEGRGIFSTYHAAKKFNGHFRELVVAGYNKYKHGVFRMPDKDHRWHIIVTRADQIEDLRKAPDDVLSFNDFVNETIFINLLMDPAMSTKEYIDYHIHVIRSRLTKNLTYLFDDLREEIQAAFDDNIPVTEDWTSFHAYSKVVQIVARATNRVFIGLPTCREPEYLKVNIDFTMGINEGRDALVRMPSFLRPFAAKYLTTVPRSVAIASKYLGPVIEERRKKIDEYGQDYPDKPIDLLSWLMEEGTDLKLSVNSLTNSMLSLNFAAIHTSSMSFTHALYHLAAEPHYIQPIREEIEAIIAKEGWSKVSMTKMHKLDSFFKESQRYTGIALVGMPRLALRDFTFSDGTFVPKGTFIAAASHPIHRDDKLYPDGENFHGFRFAEIRSQEGLNVTNQFVNTSPDYIPFGHGRHACPGRFFAANELKAMMAHLVLNYDVKMEHEGVRPPNLEIGVNCMPDMGAKVMLRRRQS